jgi:hypothetical protein
LGGELDSALGKLAVEDSPQRLQAARLIGLLRDGAAVDAMRRRVTAAQLGPTLLPILQAAGSLPASIPVETRLALWSRWAARRFSADPASLRTVFFFSFLGSSLSFGTQVFLSYRLLEFMDSARFLVSVERGVQLGFLFAAGIVVSRLVVERLPELRPGLRILLAGCLGGMVFFLDFFLYSILFLNTLPSGVLMGGACVITALGFGVGGFFRSRGLKFALAAAAMTAAIAGSWLLHAAGLSAGQFSSPLIFFEYSLSAAQICGMTFAISLFPAVLGSLQDLSVSAE